MKKNSLLLLVCCLAANLFAQVQPLTVNGRWTDDDLLFTSWLESQYNEVWGVVNDGIEYAVIGSTEGMHFISLDNGDIELEQAAFVRGNDVNASLVHRDFKHFQNYLYAVADEGNSSLQIIDYSALPDSVEVVYDSNEFVLRSHNVFVDTASQRLYVCGGRAVGTGNFNLRILDISNPAEPTLLGSYPSATFNALPYVHDVFVHDNIAYLNCGNQGFVVADFTDPELPRTLGGMNSYPDQGYNHSGWMEIGSRYYYLADENHDRDMKVVDVCDFGDISAIRTIETGLSNPTQIPHNLITRCNALYSSYYYDGVLVHDLTDPANPELIAQYDTFDGPDSNFFAGAWGVYPLLPSGKILVSDMQGGLFVFDPIDLACDPESIEQCETVSSTGTAAFAKAELNAYPNPVQNELTIELSNHEADWTVQVADLQGRILWNQHLAKAEDRSIQINAELFPAGLYIVSATSGSTQLVQKVLVY